MSRSKECGDVFVIFVRNGQSSRPEQISSRDRELHCSKRAKCGGESGGEEEGGGKRARGLSCCGVWSGRFSSGCLAPRKSCLAASAIEGGSWWPANFRLGER